MTIFNKTAVLVGLAFASTVMTAPASAQINGIATNDPAYTIATATAIGTAYQQINTQYAAQVAQINQLNTEVNTLTKQFDTDGNGQLSEAEQNAARTSNPGVVQQIQTKNTQIDQATQPIILAQYYAIEQVALQYSAALQQVVTAKNISVVLAPESTVWAAEAVDISTDVAAALNARVPSVAIVPPANWQPQRQTQQIHQLRLQLMVMSARQQAAAQQQGQQQPAQPATQPQGR